MSKIEISPINIDDDADVLFLFETRSHPEIGKCLLHNPPKDIEAHRAWLKANVPEKRLMFLLWVGSKRVGYCHAYDFTDKDTVEVGFVVHPDYQNRGYGTEMVKLLTRKLKSSMPQRKVILFVREGNTRAARLYKKLGFVEKWFQEESRFELEQ